MIFIFPGDGEKEISERKSENRSDQQGAAGSNLNHTEKTGKLSWNIQTTQTVGNEAICTKLTKY